MGTRELLEQALKLDPTERLDLVDRVLHSLDRRGRAAIDRISRRQGRWRSS